MNTGLNDLNREFYEEVFIKPAAEYGIKFVGWDYIKTEDGGIHVLRFEYGGLEYPRTKTQKEVLDELFVKDDDGQPYSCYTKYMTGDLWVFAPYFE